MYHDLIFSTFKIQYVVRYIVPNYILLLKGPQNKLINHLLNQDSFLTNALGRKGGKTNSTQKINTFVFYHENAKVSAYA